jgi:hypothetical protein
MEKQNNPFFFLGDSLRACHTLDYEFSFREIKHFTLTSSCAASLPFIPTVGLVNTLEEKGSVAELTVS